MGTSTTKLALFKPAPSDFVDEVVDLNENWDKVDAFATPQAPVASAPGDTVSTGATGKAADSGHRHAREAFGAVGDIVASALGDTTSAGASGKVADAAHRHAREAFGLPAASAPGDVQAAGVATTVARSDHVHARESASAIAAWTTYAPTWSSDSGPQPAIGNGSIVAAYRQVGKTLDIRLLLIAGTTTTFGTGGWLFSLPGALTSLVEQIAGSALGFNASSGERVGGGTAYLAASGTAFRIFGETSPQVDSWEAAIPFAWANADRLYVKAVGIEVA